jgi:hypothetical protein
MSYRQISALVLGVLLVAGCATMSTPTARQDVITATNIALLPHQAVNLTLAGVAADPDHAPEITAAAVTAAPDQAAAIEAAVLNVAPHRASEIRRAVTLARAQNAVEASALPQEVAAPPRAAEAVTTTTEPSSFTHQFINGWYPGNTFRPFWRNDSGGAEGIVR